ncbi:hypothetical protein B9J90_07125 [Vibrio sp. V09_P4A23P171]|uniref:glycosyltransferase family 4 protein n=1 Tax=Vibrio sp. V09_P4A23P171 TaxID=1938664 RepID=UPI000B8E9458|nr:glycosyltransferase family 1 protein [Vibrio sp. V09_P4A23P171]OXX36958.1 hypothetical protein B9J90_07125 [Vibrio sp. V09_P4A23P171]
MKFFYDTTEILVWEGEHTGIQRVVHGYAQGFKELRADTTFFYIHDGIGYLCGSDEVLDLKEGDIVFTASANWDRMENLCFFENAKQSGAYCVNLYYDLTPIVIPHSFKPGFCDRFVSWFGQATKSFDYHLTISEHSKKDLVLHSAELNENNVQVVRLADQIHSVDILDTPEEELFLSSYGLSEYLLSVGTIEFRKNHITLINAYRQLVKQGLENLPKLVIAGRFGWMDLDLKYQADNDPVLKGKIIFIDSAKDSQLDCLYRNCLFTLYASIYEGWGLPIAESLNYGKPCIISDNTSLPEIAPGLTHMARTLDPYDWAEKISSLYYDKDFYNASVANINEQFESTSWLNASQQILNFLEGRHSKLIGKRLL